MISIGIGRPQQLCGKSAPREEVVTTDRGEEAALVIPVSVERKAVKLLTDSGKGKWAGGKSEGLKGVNIKGNPLFKSVLEERR